MIRPLLIVLAGLTLHAQPALRTELRNGVIRAAILHASGDPVTDELPAQPGETLTVHGTGFSEATQLLVRGVPAGTIAFDENTAQFTLPSDAAGSFVEIAVADGNAATVPVDAALAADGARMAIVVVDRAGRVLAVYRRPAASDAEVEKALSLARTGAFFSNQGTPLTSRTVRAISRINFPEGIPNQPSGALFGIENTNRGCDFNVTFLPGQLYPRTQNATATDFSNGIATVPGGIPLFRD